MNQAADHKGIGEVAADHNKAADHRGQGIVLAGNRTGTGKD